MRQLRIVILKPLGRPKKCRVIGEGILGFSHADRQVAVAKLFKFLEGFVCFLSIVNAVSTIDFFSDGFNLAFQAHIQRINRRKFALAAVCQGNYFFSKVDTALAAFSEYVGQCYVNTVLSAVLANCLKLFCGILSEDVDGNYAGNAEFFNVFDMLLQIYQTFFNCLYVRGLQSVFGTPPCIFSARTVATITVASGFRPA